MNSYTNNGKNISTYIIVSILEYKYSYKCMYTQNLYLYYQERLFSSLRIMHVLNKCFCKLHKFLHYSVQSGVDKTDFFNFLQDYNRYKVINFNVKITCDTLSNDILHVKVIQIFYNLYTKNKTDYVNYTNFYTRVYTTV